jgi:hypothetical protein
MRGTAESAGFMGVPWCGFRPTPEKANSLMLVRPAIKPPAARSLATAGQSWAAGAAPCSTTEPAKVGSPATSNKSLTEMGKPASGPAGRRPCRAAARAASSAGRGELT